MAHVDELVSHICRWDTVGTTCVYMFIIHTNQDYFFLQFTKGNTSMFSNSIFTSHEVQFLGSTKGVSRSFRHALGGFVGQDDHRQAWHAWVTRHSANCGRNLPNPRLFRHVGRINLKSVCHWLRGGKNLAIPPHFRDLLPKRLWGPAWVFAGQDRFCWNLSNLYP